MPVFLSENKTYHLKQKINNRQETDEELTQSVYTVKKEDIAEIDTLKNFSSVILQNGIEFEISKKERIIFKQYWFPGLPWAVYTESQNIKAWLKMPERKSL